MARFNRIALALALGVSLAGAPASAQPPDPRIDQRVQSLPRSGEALRQQEDEAILTGRDDILLIRRRRFFTLSGSAGLAYTDNAGLAPADRQGDLFGTADVGLRVSTQLGGLVDVYAEAGVSTTRYAKRTELDLVAAFGAVGAHVAAFGFDLDFTYTPTIVWDGDVEVRQLTQHRFSASVGRSFRIGRGIVRATVGGERIEADPSAFHNWTASAGLSGLAPIGPNASLILSVRGVRRWYDDYFEGLLGVERRDRYLEGALGLAWQLHPNVTLEARVSHARNWSTADVSRYRAMTGGAAVRLAARF